MCHFCVLTILRLAAHLDAGIETEPSLWFGFRLMPVASLYRKCNSEGALNLCIYAVESIVLGRVCNGLQLGGPQCCDRIHAYGVNLSFHDELIKLPSEALFFLFFVFFFGPSAHDISCTLWLFNHPALPFPSSSLLTSVKMTPSATSNGPYVSLIDVLSKAKIDSKSFSSTKPEQVILNASKDPKHDAFVASTNAKFIDQKILDRFTRLTGRKPHRYLRRGIVFASHDLDTILDRYESGLPIYLFTGRGPSSDSLHLGHSIPFEFTR